MLINIIYMKPFINYVGSKRFLINNIKYPNSINNYYEPFIGSGTIFFDINNKKKINKNYVNDGNKEIINLYRVIKKNRKELIIKLKELDKKRTKLEFKEIVKDYNENKINIIKKVATLIYLLKISFNSNLKYGKNNKIHPIFSSSNAKKKSIYNEKNIKDISKLLKKTIIKNKDYKKFLKDNKPKEGDFIFFDPPYLVKDVKQYYKDVFLMKDFIELKNICDELNKRKVNFMITLNCLKEFKKLFKDYKIKCIDKRSTTSNRKGGYIEKEMIITNY